MGFHFRLNQNVNNNVQFYKIVREQKYSALISDKMHAHLCALDLVTMLVSILINIRKIFTKVQRHGP